MMAVDVLKGRGVPEERILFLNIIASPEGVKNFTAKFPKVRVVTAFIDDGLDERKCVLPARFVHSSAADCVQLHYSRSWGFWR